MNLVVYFDNSEDVLRIVSKYIKDYSADVYKIETNEKINFLTKYKNNISTIKRCNLNLIKYDEIIIVSPLWHNELPSPVIRFLEQMTGRIKNVTYVLYNYNKEDKPKEFEKMDRILNLKRKKSFFVTLNKKEINFRVYQ